MTREEFAEKIGWKWIIGLFGLINIGAMIPQLWFIIRDQNVKGLSVFLDRVFSSPGLSDMNITVALMGEFSRTVPDVGHNGNVTATVFGSRVTFSGAMRVSKPA